MAQLAMTYTKDGVRQVEELAKAENLSPNYSVQILTVLRQAGLVISRRGKNGGYQLARSPEEITLAEIALALEGGQMVESSPGNGGESAESVRSVWVRVNEAMLEACAEVRLSELVDAKEVVGDWVI